MGSEDPLQFFLKGIFVQEGSSGTHFDHGQFEIKTFPIYARPNMQVLTKIKNPTIKRYEVLGQLSHLIG